MIQRLMDEQAPPPVPPAPPAPPAPPGTAVWRVWHTPELAIEILSYLVRERIDLITFSTVSKHLRAVALPLLVRNLDVPLTKAPLHINFFEANPRMADCIAHLRIWDDDLESETAPRRDQVKCWEDWNDVHAPERDHWWSQTSRLLGIIISNRAKEPLPLMDISVGFMTIADFANTLHLHDKIASRIVAFRILAADLPWSEHSFITLFERYVEWSETQWHLLALTVAIICNTSSEAHLPSALRLFHIDNDEGKDWDWIMRRDSAETLGRALSATVENLAIRMYSNEDDGSNQVTTLLERDWPHLRSFELKHQTEEGDGARLQAVLDRFLTRHPLLEDLGASNTDGMGNDITCGPIPQMFPNLIHLDNFRFSQWLCPDRAAAEAVTCFDIKLGFPWQLRDFDDVTSVLHVTALPNLTELVFSSDPDYPDTEVEPTDLIRSIFAKLKDCPSLRALWVSVGRVDPLPPDTVFELDDDGGPVPPRLQFLTWGLGHALQYYRLIFVDRPEPSLAHPGADTDGERRRRFVRLHRLPPSFRNRVDQRGVWSIPGKRREGNTLFDHSCNPPRLLA